MDREELRALIGRGIARADGHFYDGPNDPHYDKLAVGVLTALDEAGMRLVSITNRGNELYCFDEDSDQ